MTFPGKLPLKELQLFKTLTCLNGNHFELHCPPPEFIDKSKRKHKD